MVVEFLHEEANGISQAECEELRRKVEDSKKQLDSNDQMIRWLNNQVQYILRSLSNCPPIFFLHKS